MAWGDVIHLSSIGLIQAECLIGYELVDFKLWNCFLMLYMWLSSADKTLKSGVHISLCLTSVAYILQFFCFIRSFLSFSSFAVRAGTGGDEAGIWAGDLVGTCFFYPSKSMALIHF